MKVIGRVQSFRVWSDKYTNVYLTDTRAKLLCIFEGKVNTVIRKLNQVRATIEVIGTLKQKV